jgi:fructose PTS system EIIBC or EIIC component
MKNTGAIVLSDLIGVNSIQLNLKGPDRDGVLEELVGRIPEIAGQPDARQSLLRALKDREQLHSTGIGDGIALPHARNALTGLVHKPVIVFARHAQGIPWGAIDAKPARLYFLLTAPTVPQHLAVLARISRLLRDVKLREDLLTVETAPKALARIREAEALM